MKSLDIKWPVYRLGSHESIYNDMGVDYIIHSGKISILDNKNLKGATLGLRRLLIPKEDIYHLKRVVFMFSELLSDNGNKYIDSEGNIFNYTKNKFVPLIWRLIIDSQPLKTITLLKVEGIPYTFEIPNNYWVQYMDKENVYLGLLDLGSYHIIYDLSLKKLKDTRRKI